VITQTLAIFHDAYRELNAKRMFWIVLALSGLVVVVFGVVGVKNGNLAFLWFETAIPVIFEPAELYRMMFSAFGISVWLAFAATILALISTASIFPDFISGGSIDLYLSKPISRLRLFVTKYLAGLLFVALQVGIFSVASYVVIGVRGGAWERGIFLAVPLVVCFFSYLYAVCVFVGVVTRSTLAAILLTMLFWFFLFCLDRGEVALLLFKTGAEREQRSLEPRIRDLDRRLANMEKLPPERQAASQNVIDQWRQDREELVRQRDSNALRNLNFAHRLVYSAKTLLPKTRETTELMNRRLLQSRPGEFQEEDDSIAETDPSGRRRRRPFSSGDVQQVDRTMRSRSIAWVIGTSLAFEGVVLALAAWVFCRRDF
jgi:ABC-type transport system involved in multi-copper enzyme maturation permease subunit